MEKVYLVAVDVVVNNHRTAIHPLFCLDSVFGSLGVIAADKISSVSPRGSQIEVNKDGVDFSFCCSKLLMCDNELSVAAFKLDMEYLDYCNIMDDIFLRDSDFCSWDFQRAIIENEVEEFKEDFNHALFKFVRMNTGR